MDVAVELVGAGRAYWRMEYVVGIVEEMGRCEEEDVEGVIGEKITELLKALCLSSFKVSEKASILMKLMQSIVSCIAKFFGFEDKSDRLKQ